MTVVKDVLTGLYFHTFDPATNEILCQGQIDRVDRRHGLVRATLFSWMDGLPNGVEVFPLADTAKWRLYEHGADMDWAWCQTTDDPGRNHRIWLETNRVGCTKRQKRTELVRY